MAHKNLLSITSLSELNDLLGCPKPKHPLVNLIRIQDFKDCAFPVNTSVNLAFYCVSLKKCTGRLAYGRSYYDFSEGTLTFFAPNQTISLQNSATQAEGWMLCFHPDLVYNSPFAKKLDSYRFFDYDSNEALHVSDDEKRIIEASFKNIKREYSQNIDQHTGELILSNIELLLNYCNRFYDRQFLTRKKVNSDTVAKFENLLKTYFSQKDLIEKGLPSVKHFADELSFSPNYLSDLLTRYTGKSTQEHIHLQLIERAKSELLGSDKTIGEIAYDLGFEYPSHFTKIFKHKTGVSPSRYRTIREM
ncbi:AraC family transcriptional regulator (plasmid) [Fulvitalea axinellae]|uniref:AraC family transcriptional regulator n=1 Tax=Fulvitalea axinellae TaxID=1182444 RepID=A0AAU9CH77_9BACT|nr:AraC family transcriptional regulator [Fulvitalea axinellae]